MSAITSVQSTAIKAPAVADDRLPVQADADSEDKKEDKAASTRVTLSGLGKMLSGQAAKQPVKNQDIEDSNLPDNIKDLLKRIRELKEQLREQQQKLNAIMANQSLSPDERQKQLTEVQATMNALSSALTSAIGQMDKMVRDQKLSKEQQISAASLLAV
ncbi:hypothetical protein D3C72_67340 [compost metagenome]